MKNVLALQKLASSSTLGGNYRNSGASKHCISGLSVLLCKR